MNSATGNNALPIRRLFLSAAYVAVALLVNYTISWWPPREVFGINMPPGLLLVGLVFVMRDYAQREIGQGVIGLTLLAALLTYFLVDPVVALASGLAFIVSEGIDQLIFTITKRPLKDRIVISSFVAVPFDGLIFLGLMGWLTTELFLVHYALKMIASLLMWVWLNNRYNKPNSLAAAE